MLGDTQNILIFAFFEWEPPIGYIPDSQKNWELPIEYTPKQKEIVNNIDSDIEDLFDEDALFTDISRETKYINNKFDKLTIFKNNFNKPMNSAGLQS